MISEKIDKVIKEILPLEDDFRTKARERLDSLTKPQGSLGRLEELAAEIVAIRRDLRPELKKRIFAVFAGDHGVAEEGVSAFPPEVTPQMVFNFLRGGAGINVLAKAAGAEVAVVDIGVNYEFENVKGLINKKVMKGTRNMAKGPAMTMDEAVKSVEAGIDVALRYADEGYNLFGTGEMGIGNTTPSSAIVSVFSGLSPHEVTGRGTGVNDGSFENKVSIIENAIKLNRPDASNPMDVLAKVGGTEIGGIAGFCIGAASRRIPVLIDGFISTAGALIACKMAPSVRDYIFSSHQSVEKGHIKMLEIMRLRPLVNLDLRLGEGTGAAIGMMIVESALRIYNDMSTFEEAQVSGSN